MQRWGRAMRMVRQKTTWHSVARFAAMFLVAGAGLGCAFQGSGSVSRPPVPAAAVSPDPAKQWIGRTLNELQAQLGPPSDVITELGDTDGGGKIIVYAQPGQPHMVFETAPGSQTISKARTIK
jgi:hypothetical protein